MQNSAVSNGIDEARDRASRADSLVEAIKRHFEAGRFVNKGVCLLNAGEYDEASTAFQAAAQLGSTDGSLPQHLAACLSGAEKEDPPVEHHESPTSQAASQIRQALVLWTAGNHDESIAVLRDAISQDSECAELHFQLGTLLTSLNQFDEAELRFTQAITIDLNHIEALMSLAMCCGIRGAATEAVTYLQRAQAHKPYDARIGLLLAQAVKAARHNGNAPRVRATMSDSALVHDAKGIDELSRVIETEPDFVDAFLSIPMGEVDEQVFAMLLETLRRALERQPEHAELHYHCGRVLERLGRPDDAIDENVRAVEIDPRFTKALIELGKLYQQTDRECDARARLEQAVQFGAEYADVFYLLGNLYRSAGEVGLARTAYARAISINRGYSDARTALASLPA